MPQAPLDLSPRPHAALAPKFRPRTFGTSQFDDSRASLCSSDHNNTAKMGRGPKKHQKRLSAPSHWLLDKLSGAYAPKASPGPHKLRDCMPLIVFIRNR